MYFDFVHASGVRRWSGWTVYYSIDELLSEFAKTITSQYIQENATQVLVKTCKGDLVFLHGSVFDDPQELLKNTYPDKRIHIREPL